MKITNSSEKITPFGGFNFVIESFKNSGLSMLIDNHLGSRVKTVGFSYSDIFINHLAVYLNGGDCTEDINDHLRGHLQNVRGMRVCSADTILRGIKELATDTLFMENPDSGVKHGFNLNPKLNNLLVKGLIQTEQLKTGIFYDLDYDNQVQPTEKYDAEKTYKKTNGYQPGIASISNPDTGQAMPVYIEGRNGNSQAKYLQEETLERVFSNLGDNGIKVGRFRADSASYQKKVVELVERQGSLLYIRAKRCAKMDGMIGSIAKGDWKKIRLGIQEMEVADIQEYFPFGGEKPYRLVISRIKRKDSQTDIFSGEAYTYRGILTNDRESSNSEVVAFYNARGQSECLFDVMNNDFGWAKMPCSFLSENTAFMIMTAIYANFYSYLIAEYSKKLSWLKPCYRLKKFIFRFITVSAKWIRTGRKHVLKLFTQKDYSPILT
ncbi:IS1380 family transposase [Belliella sp. DSM 107340]|uniref:IS1380 family transposase n=1 Tax=Belliella calami TaxID=2923436 RepID=A0ABS9UPD0_9BACT|nr:IS1380 family transposase [Belliella calami]MCH7398477.1 IS1380 family transposase [Belliella calami]MCH7398481.1 IS1380 family transposase [Belliella calami]